MSKNYIAYIGTNSVRSSKGIYTINVDGDTGHLSVLGTTKSYNTGYLALAGGHNSIYAVSEGMTFQGEASGGIMAYHIGEDHIPVYLNGYPTRGQRPCCTNCSPDGDMLYVCNFYGSSMAGFPVKKDGSLEQMSFFIREESMPDKHDGMHCVYAMQDGTICAIVLGQNKVICYDGDNHQEIGNYAIPDGYAPRQLVADADSRFIYLLMQRPGQIFVLENHLKETGTLEKIQEISVIEDGYEGMYATAAVRMTADGKYLLASTRGADTMALFVIDQSEGALKRTGVVKLAGRFPRDFNITEDGKYAVIAYQMSDEVGCCRIDAEKGTLSECDRIGNIPSPAAVVIRNR